MVIWIWWYKFFSQSVETYIYEIRKLTWRSTGHTQLHKSKRTVQILNIFQWPLQYIHIYVHIADIKRMIMNRNTATQRKKSILCMAQCKQRLHEIVSDQVTILHVANQRTISAYKKKGNRTSTRYCTWITRLWTNFFHIRKDQAFSYWMTCFHAK